MIIPDPGFTCGLCGDGGMTEQEAVAHECGVVPPEPTLAEIPMLTREAVTILANQLASIADALTSLRDSIDANTHQTEQIVNRMDQFMEYPMKVRVL